MRVRSSFLLVAALGAATLPLGGCDSFNRAIGKTRVIPDEFQVVSNAPLAIPPDYALRPPRVGNGPEQSNPTDQARETVFRAGDTAAAQQQAAAAPRANLSAGEQDLLRQAGAAGAPSDIRQTVDADPTEGVPFDRSLVDKLLFWSGPTTPVSTDTLNPGQEASRIRVAQSVARPGGPPAPPADAPVPTFEHGQKKSGWFSWF